MTDNGPSARRQRRRRRRRSWAASGSASCAEVFGYDRTAHGPAAVRLRAGHRGAGRAAHRHRHPDHGRARARAAGPVRHRLDHRLGAVRPRALAGAARRVPGRARPRRDDRQPLHRRVRARRGRPARRHAGDDALEVRRRAGRPVPRGRRSTPRCSTSTTARCSPAPGRRPASTPCCTWSAASGAPAAANALAREMVVPPHRDGGQAQFIDAPVPACEDDLLGAVLEWAGAHLAEDISVELLARRALMSPRSFARRFKATTGTTPHAWLLGQRLAAAEALLEESDAPVEEIARLVGFGTAAGLREQFTRRRGVSPRAYRQTFRAGARLSAGTAPVQLDRAAGGWRGGGRSGPGRGGARSAGVARRRPAAPSSAVSSGRVGLHQRLGRDVRGRRAGAPPVQVVPARGPSRGGRTRRCVVTSTGCRRAARRAPARGAPAAASRRRAWWSAGARRCAAPSGAARSPRRRGSRAG